MRRTLIAALLLCALAPAPAHAGSYDVAACAAPGGGGVNNSWVARNSNDAWYDVGPLCATSNSAPSLSSEPNDSAQPGFFSAAEYRFRAPEGTRITKLDVWRYGYSFGNGLQAEAFDEENRLLGDAFAAETCRGPSGSASFCEFGDPQGFSERARRVFTNLDTASVRYAVDCARNPSCDAADENFPFAAVRLYGAVVTLSESTAPELRMGGPLLAPGWRRGTESLTIGGSDDTGIRQLVAADGSLRVARVEPRCDPTAAVPCEKSVDRSLVPENPLLEGTRRIEFEALDGAFNRTRRGVTVRVDRSQPTIALDRPDTAGEITAAVADQYSGVASGTIAVRETEGQPFRDLPTTLEGGRLVARTDGASAAGLQIRVTAADVAGNRAELVASPSRLIAGVGRRPRSKATLGHNSAPSLSGVLTGLAGAPVGGRELIVRETVARTGAAPREVARVLTGPDGRFAFRAARGPSRVFEFVLPAGGGQRPAVAGVVVGQRASTSISLRPRTLRPRGLLRISGKLRTRGEKLPSRGKLVEVQAFDRGRWRVFGSTRARPSRDGRWTVRYRFGPRSGRYVMRARMRREGDFPFELGYSRRAVVRVR